MRWAEECRAHTESLPTPISGPKGQNINTPDLRSAVRAHTHTHDCSPAFHKKTPTCIMYLTHIAHILTHLLLLYSEKPNCSAPWRSSVPAAGHWPQTAEGERGHREREREDIKKLSQRGIKCISFLKLIANSSTAGPCHHLATLRALSSQSITLVIFDRSSGRNTQAQQTQIYLQQLETDTIYSMLVELCALQKIRTESEFPS